LGEPNSELTSTATNLQNVSMSVLFQVPVSGSIPGKLQGIRKISAGRTAAMPSVVFAVKIIVHLSGVPVVDAYSKLGVPCASQVFRGLALTIMSEARALSMITSKSYAQSDCD
jgi:hypothetical protein